MQKINETNNIAVRTHTGLSQRKVVNKITCQGEPWGPIECSVHIDNIGKESLKPHMEPYTYKNEVEIPALGWIDDLITVSESGYKTARINALINAQIASKKLRLGAKKCFMMHVGNKHEDYKNNQLYVDGWDVQTVESYTAGEKDWIDTPIGGMNEISLLYRFFSAQLSNPTKGDWVSEILEVMEEMELDMELEDIGHISKRIFKSIVK